MKKTMMDTILGVKSVDETVSEMVKLVDSFDETRRSISSFPMYNLLEPNKGKSLALGRMGEDSEELAKDFDTLKDKVNNIVAEWNSNGLLETEHLYARKLNKLRKEMRSELRHYKFVCDNFWDWK